jgi:hypothetical protein
MPLRFQLHKLDASRRIRLDQVVRQAVIDEAAKRLLPVARRRRRLLVEDVLDRRGMDQRNALAVVISEVLKDGAAVALRTFGEAAFERAGRIVVSADLEHAVVALAYAQEMSKIAVIRT